MVNDGALDVAPGWTLAGIGDYNGKDDLLWHNTASGTFTEWQSTGPGFTPNAIVNSTVAANWTLIGNPTNTHA